MAKNDDASSRQSKECNDERTEDPPQPEQLEFERRLPTLIVSDQQTMIPSDGIDWFGRPVPEFVIGNALTVFDACMIYTDRNPAVFDTFSPDGNHDGASTRHRKNRLSILGAEGGWLRDAYGDPMGPKNNEQERISNEVYREIKRDIKANRITPLKLAYCDDDPEIFDPTRCTITLDVILDIARRRGDGGEWIKTLLPRNDSEGSRTPEGELRPSPGPKGGQQQRLDELCWNYAVGFLNQNRVPRGHGRLATLAQLVNTELKRKGIERRVDTIAKSIRRSLREWEKKNPEK